MSQNHSSSWEIYADVLTMSGDWEKQQQGLACISVENSPLYVSETLHHFCRDHFSTFLRLSRYLSPGDQVLLMTHALLGWPGTRMAIVAQQPQSTVSKKVVAALRTIGYVALCGGQPKPEQIEATCQRHNLSRDLVLILFGYLSGMTSQQLGHELGIAPKDVRSTILDQMKAVQVRVTANDHVPAELIAFAGYLSWFHHKYAPYIRGEEKPKTITRRDHNCLGEFRVDVSNCDMDQIFPRDGREADDGTAPDDSRD